MFFSPSEEGRFVTQIFLILVQYHSVGQDTNFAFLPNEVCCQFFVQSGLSFSSREGVIGEVPSVL